jgi:septal ring factor EnvC (AmiA/AmiB activator)
MTSSESEQPRRGKRIPLALTLITFCIGVAATSAWQSYGDAAREMIARSSPRLGWLAPQAAPVARNTSDMIAPAAPAAPSPDQEQLNAMSLDLDAARQSIDRIATSIATSQEQMTRSIDQLAAGREQMTREITKLQEIEQSNSPSVTRTQSLRRGLPPPRRPSPCRGRRRHRRCPEGSIESAGPAPPCL